MSLITKSSEMPLKNWKQIIEPSNGEIDLNYMFTDITAKNIINQSVEDAYINLLSELPEQGKTSFEYFTLFLAELQKCKIQTELNNLTGLISDVTNVSYSECERHFIEYAHKINNEHHLLNFDEFYFENLPESFLKIRKVIFYHFSEYLLFIENFEERENYLNDLFLKKHLKNRTISINILELDKYLNKSFMSKGYYHEYFEVRADLFNVNNLKFEKDEKEHKINFEYELAVIQKITGIRLSLNENVLSEYIAAKQLMKEINDSNKK